MAVAADLGNTFGNKDASDHSEGSGSESEQDDAEEIDESDCIILKNISNLQLELPEYEESVGLGAEKK